MATDNRDWLTVEDIYEALGKRIPMDTIRSWIRSGRLPAYKPSRTILVKREEFEKFIRESRTTGNDN